MIIGGMGNGGAGMGLGGGRGGMGGGMKYLPNSEGLGV